MKDSSGTGRWVLLAAGVTIVAVFTFWFEAAAQPPTSTKASKSSKKSDPKRNGIDEGPPVTLGDLLKWVAAIKNRHYPEPAILAAIEKRGLDLKVAREDLNTIQNLGASQELVGLVKKLLPPLLQPPPPPPPVTGTLFVACAPAECKVSIDGANAQLTKAGDFQQFQLPLKQYRVDFSREGYLPKSIVYAVTTSDKPEKEFVTLDPSPVTKAKWGRELLDAAIKAVEGSAGSAALRNMTVSGAAVSTDGAGTYSEWNISATFKSPPKSADYELTKASNRFSMRCVAEQCEVPKPKGNLLRGKSAATSSSDSLDTSLRLLNRYNLVSLLERVSAPNQNVVAGGPRSFDSSEQHFTIQNSDETYDIALNPNLQPSKVVYTSGALSVQVTYGDYTTVLTGARYPSRTTIQLSGGKQTLQVNLGTFGPAAAR